MIKPNSALLSSIALSVVIGLSPAMAQTHRSPDPPFLPQHSERTRGPHRATFERQLARFAAYEVAASDIALHKLRRPAVRSLAHELKKHGKIVLAGIRANAVKRHGQPPSARLNGRQESALDHMRFLGEPYLGVHYVQRMVAAYQMARRLVQSYARSGRDAEERRFAQSLLPKVADQPEAFAAGRRNTLTLEDAGPARFVELD